jgi:hypothetical protein
MSGKLNKAMLIGMAISIGLFGASLSMAEKYEGGAPGGASITGKITFKGTPPAPKLFSFAKFPQPNFCSQADSDGKGNRVLKEVNVENGALRDVVIYIEDVKKGKPFNFKGTEVKANMCRFLAQGSPSTFVGVVMNKAKISIENTDADPSDPKTKDGVLHNPHGYEVKGSSNTTMFNKPLPTKGQVITEKVKLRKHDSAMKVECDQHGFMQVWFFPVENPYYVIDGNDGTFTIDQVPAGKYEVEAWHPILGHQEKEVTVGDSGKVNVDFEFKAQ